MTFTLVTAVLTVITVTTIIFVVVLSITNFTGKDAMVINLITCYNYVLMKIIKSYFV